MNDRLLIVAAHEDDEVLGCGATIAKYRKLGCAVRVIFLAEGTTPRFNPEQFDTPEVVEQIAARNAQAISALSQLGVESREVYFSVRQGCRLDRYPLIELTREIADHIADFRPTIVLTHWSADTNVDHRTVHQAVLAAARPIGSSPPRLILAFEILSSTEWNTTTSFPANYFISISEEIEAKIEAMRAYGSEMRSAPHSRSPEVIRALSVYRGAQTGVAHAEAFVLIRATEY